MKVHNRCAVTHVKFSGYRGLRDYSIRLVHMNLLVGPNNCGKSTILGAFRVLAQAIRRARSRPAEMLQTEGGRRAGWRVPNETLPIASENIHSDYADINTTIDFHTSNGGIISLNFPAAGGCLLFARHEGDIIRGHSEFKQAFPIEIHAVPVLGPLEHEEPRVLEETVRKNLLTTRASRNFRNYWLCYPDAFEQFSALVRKTWPGMDIQRPEYSGSMVAMFCLENRISRELFWAGFGFQVWLQLLTHISRATKASLLIVDEPEIYLHPDVQRQLLGILRDCGADVLLATHSTELMSEADPTEILLVDKHTRNAKRLKDSDDVQAALELVGSTQNITLTRLARNRRLLFVEGDSDFQILRRFARRFEFHAINAATEVTAVESGGFSSWQEVKALATGFERALSAVLNVAAIYDRDYWCAEEIEAIQTELRTHLQFAHILQRKEIENYLLVPAVLQRALDKAIAERFHRTGTSVPRIEAIEVLLDKVTSPIKADMQSQYIAKRVKYFAHTKEDPATTTSTAIRWFEAKWSEIGTRMAIVPGKIVLAAVRSAIAEKYAVSVTDHRIVNEFARAEVPDDLLQLLQGVEEYARR